MTALRQARIHEERARQRVAESVARDFKDQIRALHESNRDQIIKLARLERVVADRDQTIVNLQGKMAEQVEQTQAGYKLVLGALKGLPERV